MRLCACPDGSHWRYSAWTNFLAFLLIKEATGTNFGGTSRSRTVAASSMPAATACTLNIAECWTLQHPVKALCNPAIYT